MHVLRVWNLCHKFFSDDGYMVYIHRTCNRSCRTLLNKWNKRHTVNLKAYHCHCYSHCLFHSLTHSLNHLQVLAECQESSAFRCHCCLCVADLDSLLFPTQLYLEQFSSLVLGRFEQMHIPQSSFALSSNNHTCLLCSLSYTCILSSTSR